jgi:hypothetical protein
MFASPAAPPQPSHAPAPPPPAQSGPGEFTRFFQAPKETASPTSHPAMADPFGKSNAPSVTSSSGPGEFTRMFGTPNQPMSAPNSGGGYTTPPQQGQGPSEYTRMFATPVASSPAAAPLSVPSAATPAVSQQKAAPNYLPLIIIFGVLFVLAVALVLYFALKK